MSQKYKSRDKEGFDGVSAPLDQEIENNFMVVPKMWQEASVNGTIQKLAGMMDTPPMILASFDDSYIIGFCQVKSSYIYEVDYILGSRRFYDFMLQLEIKVS
mgnify:CR=1 FL=1